MFVQIATLDLAGSDLIATVRFACEGDVSWLPKRVRLDPVLTAGDFVVAQEILVVRFEWSAFAVALPYESLKNDIISPCGVKLI